jgi:hypothetical protein
MPSFGPEKQDPERLGFASLGARIWRINLPSYRNSRGLFPLCPLIMINPNPGAHILIPLPGFDNSSHPYTRKWVCVAMKQGHSNTEGGEPPRCQCCLSESLVWDSGHVLCSSGHVPYGNGHVLYDMMVSSLSILEVSEIHGIGSEWRESFAFAHEPGGWKSVDH